MQSDYFTLPELARRWKISVPTIRRKLSSGEIQSVHIGRAVRVERAEVERVEKKWAWASAMQKGWTKGWKPPERPEDNLPPPCVDTVGCVEPTERGA